MTAAKEDLRYLTVVTYGRTGSTVLQSALNALPGVMIRGENYSALRGLNAYVQALAETADRHHAGKPTHPWFGSARLDPSAVVTDLRQHVLSTVLRPRTDTTWIGFKEVRYEPGHFVEYDDLLNYLLFLDKLFPGIAYVINVRDPQDAARSGWWPDNANAQEVLTTTRAWLTDATADLTRMLGPGRAVLLDYDEWDGHPEIVIEAFAELGLPRDDAAVRATVGARLGHGQHGGEPGAT
ncbi:MAG: sulfotransferase [Actinobacteria bacterium]|nr:sulfotransferase [Actinomycetota bacterium]